MYDTLDDLTYSIPTGFSFSCYELDHFPSRCKEWFHEQLSNIESLDSDESSYLADKLVEYMANFRRVEGNIDSGYVFDAKLEILCFSVSGVYKGRYVTENREEVIKCSVCLENLTEGMELSAYPCSHMFHTSCLDPWLERVDTCPNCRYNLEDAEEDWLKDLLDLNEPIRRIPST
ncbi:hypothetical protein POM88_002635 [Heracleum sosnowskyi]|uniref:RING-type E3 ubiquitin transferase n=1 Tax=Heracleum sosnowskyi TaxID=360622 RepID=A0AAD8JIT3_9APIA|nr:hypothetical protein POM88_002635 [Heracleum sosnowskyi]